MVDAKITHRDFVVRDGLFLHVRPRKRSIKLEKLAARFMGAFEVIQKVNPVAYKLKLPPNLSKLHNVFHVSLLKKYVHDPAHVWDLDQL